MHQRMKPANMEQEWKFFEAYPHHIAWMIDDTSRTKPVRSPNPYAAGVL